MCSTVATTYEARDVDPDARWKLPAVLSEPYVGPCVGLWGIETSITRESHVIERMQSSCAMIHISIVVDNALKGVSLLGWVTLNSLQSS